MDSLIQSFDTVITYSFYNYEHNIMVKSLNCGHSFIIIINYIGIGNRNVLITNNVPKSKEQNKYKNRSRANTDIYKN